MDENFIIGIDHGYEQMKTVHSCFKTAITKVSGRPSSLEDILQYDNQYYTLNGKDVRAIEVHDKAESEEFFLLTLAALAKECNYRGIRKGEIRLATGLPPKWYYSQAQSFQNFLSKRKKLFFNFEGENYNFEIQNVSVYMQGHAAALKYIIEMKKSGEDLILVDIGGETIDIVYYVKGKMIVEKCYISTKGMIWLYKMLSERVRSELYEDVPDVFIEKYINTGHRTKVPQNRYHKILQKYCIEYAEDVFNQLKEYKFNLELTPIIFMGGGEAVIRNFGTYDEYNLTFIEDIHANAIGYELIEKSKLNHIKR